MAEGQFPSLLCIEDPVSKGKEMLLALSVLALVASVA